MWAWASRAAAARTRRAIKGLESYLRGHDVFRLEAMRFAICNPTASLCNNRTQLHAAIEFACLDIIGRKLGVPEFGRGIEDIANDYFRRCLNRTQLRRQQGLRRAR